MIRTLSPKFFARCELANEHSTELDTAKAMAYIFSCAAKGWADDNEPQDHIQDHVYFYTRALLKHLDRVEEAFEEYCQATRRPAPPSKPDPVVEFAKTAFAAHGQSLKEVP
jgi:hypothetical protein